MLFKLSIFVQFLTAPPRQSHILRANNKKQRKSIKAISIYKLFLGMQWVIRLSYSSPIAAKNKL